MGWRISESVGDGQQLVGLLHGLDLGVRLLVHGLVAPPGVIQKLLLRGLELPDLSHLQESQGSSAMGEVEAMVFRSTPWIWKARDMLLTR
ncbi:hypothetical protein EYF80_036791 [Liparis tanakae]|uniref:Uncharacterized protein n=1 Tax=Liparis tanakae TaxID=230148 RepID=A0A4Z2GJS7_9TELE|nr:hypothetical protein EYF80_036791 [Liparis tanakae]